MTTTDAARPPSAPKSLPARIIGVLTSPADTFRSVAAHPRWFGMLLLGTLVVAGLQFWLLSTEVGQTAMLEQQERQMESFGQPMSDQQYDEFERRLPLMRYFVAGFTVVIGPLITFIIAGLLYAVFNAGLGGDAKFKQVLSIVTHAGVVPMLGAIFATPLNYVRESMTSPTTVSVFFPMLEEGSLAARFLGLIDLFWVWWLVVLSIGLAVLYRRRTQSVLIGLMTMYIVIIAVIALVMRGMAGSV
jgi:hypothetical protein